MDNTYYILAKTKIDIERLHICTWEFPNETSYIEFGMEFAYDAFTEDVLEFYLTAACFKKNGSTGDNDDNANHYVESLHANLINTDNARFIFNDVAKGTKNISDSNRNGAYIEFAEREYLTVLPCKIKLEDGYAVLKIAKPEREKTKGNMYFRILVKLENPVAIIKKGISQATYIYDLKINEKRNIPSEIYGLIDDKDLKICSVKNLFCFHAIPDNFSVNFVDSSKLRNIRKLETKAFQNYLPQITGISKDCYNIIFLKDKGADGYSFFSMCTEEIIGSKQIAFAVGANILCSLLFAISSLNFAENANVAWYLQIPWNYWFAFGVLLLLCIYFFSSIKKKL